MFKSIASALLSVATMAMSENGTYAADRLYLGKKEHGRDYNFCPGPCILPEAVMEQARDEMMNWRGTGTSVNEMNHRGPEFTKIAKEAEADIRELLDIPSNFKVLML